MEIFRRLQNFYTFVVQIEKHLVLIDMKGRLRLRRCRRRVDLEGGKTLVAERGLVAVGKLPPERGRQGALDMEMQLGLGQAGNEIRQYFTHDILHLVRFFSINVHRESKAAPTPPVP